MNNYASTDILRPLIDLRDRTIQKNRIAFQQRLMAIDQERDTADPFTYDMLTRYKERFIALEAEIDEDINTIAGDIEIIQRASAVHGVGLMLASKLVAMIDIERAGHVSSLWRFAGMAVTPACTECGTVMPQGNGNKCTECGGEVTYRADRPRKGQKLPYNSRLKVYCWQLATSFLRSNSPYRAIYDKSKEYYEANRPDWNKSRRHRAAMRKMIKVFLQHLWVTWRTIENLPVTEPYSHAHQAHESYLKPEEFGWEAVSNK